MPKYDFKCQKCEKLSIKVMPIPEFLKTHKNSLCEFCQGPLSHQVNQVKATIEQSKDQIILDIKDDVQKTVDKLNAGDERTILEIYGDRENPYK